MIKYHRLLPLSRNISQIKLKQFQYIKKIIPILYNDLNKLPYAPKF